MCNFCSAMKLSTVRLKSSMSISCTDRTNLAGSSLDSRRISVFDRRNLFSSRRSANLSDSVLRYCFVSGMISSAASVTEVEFGAGEIGGGEGDGNGICSVGTSAAGVAAIATPSTGDVTTFFSATTNISAMESSLGATKLSGDSPVAFP